MKSFVPWCLCGENSTIQAGEPSIAKEIGHALRRRSAGAHHRGRSTPCSRSARRSGEGPPACCSPGCRSGASSRPGVTGCGNASASRRPRPPWPETLRFGRLTRPHRGHGPPSACIACGAMEPASSGQARRRRLRTNHLPEFRESGGDVPVGTAASARSTQALRCFIEASAIHTLIRQRPPTPSCRGPSPYCGTNSGPGRRIKAELDIQSPS